MTGNNCCSCSWPECGGPHTPPIAAATCTLPTHPPLPSTPAAALRIYWPLAVAVYGSYMAKLLPELAWHEAVQNVGMLAGLVTLAVLSRYTLSSTYRSGCRRLGGSRVQQAAGGRGSSRVQQVGCLSPSPAWVGRMPPPTHTHPLFTRLAVALTRTRFRTVCSRLRPATYRREGPRLRLLLLTCVWVLY